MTETTKDGTEMLSQLILNGIEIQLNKKYPFIHYEIKDRSFVFYETSLEIVPVIDQILQEETRWLYAVSFGVIIDGERQLTYTAGFVGVGDTEIEAAREAVAAWLIIVGSPLIRFTLREKADLKTHRFDVYIGGAMIRGEPPPGELAQWLRPMRERFLSVCNQHLDNGIAAVDLMISFDANGIFTGQCRINGSVSPKLDEVVMALGWPSQSWYILRQYYIFKAV